MASKNFTPLVSLLLVASIAMLSGCMSAKSRPVEEAPVASPAPLLDSDNDGVTDNLDECPNTRPGATVDSRGCEIILRLPGANFDVDKSTLKPGVIADLNDAAKSIRERNLTKIEIAGHTDSSGSDAYNKQLGYERALSVAQYFIELGLNPAIFSVTTYGESRPIASNQTESGKAQNRRVEIVDLE